jgi:hypothetical protein
MMRSQRRNVRLLAIDHMASHSSKTSLSEKLVIREVDQPRYYELLSEANGVAAAV